MSYYELANSEDPDKMWHNSAFHHRLYMAFSSKIKQRQFLLNVAIDAKPDPRGWAHFRPKEHKLGKPGRGPLDNLAYQISDKIFKYYSLKSIFSLCDLDTCMYM